MKARALFVSILLLSMITMSCGSSRLRSISPTEVLSSTPSATKTSDNTLTPEPSKTSVPTLLPSLTPLPTYLPDNWDEIILNLIHTNDGCNLPCWWGISPGISSMSIEKQRLEQFIMTLGGERVIESTDYSGVSYYYEDQNLIGNVNLLAQNDTVVAISSDGFYAITRNYAIQDILRNYAEPDEIWIYTWPESMGENVLHFAVTLDYSSQGFLVYYFSEMGKPVPGTDMNELCYSREAVPPKIITWDPSGDNPFSINKWDRIYEIWDQMKPIEEATGMSNQEFIIWFASGSELQEYCIQTPASIWQSP